MTIPAIASDNGVYCENLLREQDRDCWLACLFAPAQHRAALHALYAFNIEISRVRDVVSAPLPGEVRLQWWRDIFTGEVRGDVTSHPVASALLEAIRHYQLPMPAFEALVNAHVHDLYDDLLPTITDMEGYCGETSSALFRLACLVLADGSDPGTADAAGHAGVAYGAIQILKNVAKHAARGQIFIPADILALYGNARDDLLLGKFTADAKGAFTHLSGIAGEHLMLALQLLPSQPLPVLAVYQPLALMRPALNRMGKDGFDPFKHSAEPAQWRKQWTLWRFANTVRSL